MGNTISKYEYEKVGQLLHWASAEHYVILFRGEKVRDKRTEVMLPRLVKKGKLIRKRFGKKFIYTVPRRKNDHNYEHGLGCTEGLVRFYRSDPSGMIIPERHFRGFGIVPEWGIRYKNGKMILFEFCTDSNFYRPGLVKSKITRYNKYLRLIEKKFNATAVVLFVCDAPRRDVEKFVWNRETTGNEVYFFVDYETFKSVPIGEQLYASIYIWGEDCYSYPLREKNV